MSSSLTPARADRITRDRGYTATLECGTSLAYEAPSWIPIVGELVPCRNHGYCRVQTGNRVGGRGPRDYLRARPRSQRELLDRLQHQPVTTIHSLRRHGFTLRMLLAAQHDGQLAVDIVSGRVSRR